jgi:hypothetical protein
MSAMSQPAPIIRDASNASSMQMIQVAACGSV